VHFNQSIQKWLLNINQKKRIIRSVPVN